MVKVRVFLSKLVGWSYLREEWRERGHQKLLKTVEYDDDDVDGDRKCSLTGGRQQQMMI